MTTAQSPLFPLFSEKFFGASPVPTINAAPTTTSPPGQVPLPKPKVLDLKTVPRDDGPPTELRTRKEKLAHFEKECTHVGEQLYVGAEAVARSRQILKSAGITHIVNCVGFLYQSYFEDEVTYQTLYLNDTPHEDILCVLYDVFDFIREAKESNKDGRVLLHCSQGVSRSATLAIAYLMWTHKQAYEEVFADVKSKRGVANPNIGFICQLMQWHKRLTEEADKDRLYRIAPQCSKVSQYLVPKIVSGTPTAEQLDPRGAFVLHTPTSLFIWVGAQSPDQFATAAHRVAKQLQRYEGAADPVVVVEQGKETAAFWEAIHWEQGSKKPYTATQVARYDADYATYSRSPAPPGSGDNNDSARSGRKTPRDAADFAYSPNDRLRKQARSDAVARDGSSTGRSGYSDRGEFEVAGRSSPLDSARALSFQENQDGATTARSRSRLSELDRQASQAMVDDVPLAAPRTQHRPRPSPLPPLNLQRLQIPSGGDVPLSGSGSARRGGVEGKGGRRPVPKIMLPRK